MSSFCFEHAGRRKSVPFPVGARLAQSVRTTGRRLDARRGQREFKRHRRQSTHKQGLDKGVDSIDRDAVKAKAKAKTDFKREIKRGVKRKVSQSLSGRAVKRVKDILG